MFLNSTLQEAISDFMVSALGDDVNVIWANQNNLVPARPFVTLNISSFRNKSSPPIIERVSQDIFKYRFQRQFTLTVNVYSVTDYFKYISDIRDALVLPINREILRVAGLAINTVSDAVDLTDLLETDMEQRASLDIALSYGEDKEQAVGEMETIEISGTGEMDKIDFTVTQ